MNTDNKTVVGYLVFNRIQVENANAISSPITYGFPAITGFLGAAHAMSRRLQNSHLAELSLGGVLIACHDCQPQVYQASSYSDFTFNQSRNPIKRDGKTASIIEEGKCHLTVSLAIEVLVDEDEDDDESLNSTEIEQLIANTTQWIQQQRLAGGSVKSLAKFNPVTFVEPDDIDQIKPLIMPAFVLMDAHNDLTELTGILQEKDHEQTALDALVDVCVLHHIPQTDSQGNTHWSVESAKEGRGWLVPIPVGYQGISDVFEAGEMQHARNSEYRSQYVESIYSLGKWVFPHRINDLATAFWQYHHDAESQLYLTIQPNQ
ncbi:type I-F CRISPR-associated protein Csy2 [Aliidiomarina taiwanensis]|uniref:Type I-F CRISPR-associated protein Csy2 n=1 Tax=Aliidiomarina taiwanensis TaxID=946228 RepID=A0A432X7J7_9GAMM|nr:type I-F CRISPR-associated protein Csy2 [Aliidiomarina taiwanensis]RUO42767.1 type I-F CRISPR-associated protein Csy2 [Aliidiomarina taiwanensis]